MGRRSINTTKSGKYMNPTDQARKEARKKELKKNKKQRQMVRAAVLKMKDPTQILEELHKIDEMEYNVLQPSPLNEKVLKEKRKKLRETFDRVLKMYDKDEPEKWFELKKQEIEYEKKRMLLISYFESVKRAQSVQVSDIPLPSTQYSEEIMFPGLPSHIPMPMDSLAPQMPPKPILKRDSAYRVKSGSGPPGVPPGLPPDYTLLLSEASKDLLIERPQKKTIRFSDINDDDGPPGENPPLPEDHPIDDPDLDPERSSSPGSKQSGAKPTSLQQRMLALSGQNIDDFMKEMEEVHKKRERDRAADLNARLTALKRKDHESDSESDEEMPPLPLHAPLPPDCVMMEPPGTEMRLPPPLMPHGLLPPLGAPLVPPLRLPPGPPPGRPIVPPGPPPGLPRGMLRPPGPPPGAPRLHRPLVPPLPKTNPPISVLTAGPQLLPKKDSLHGATISAKPQIRNLSADVTRFVPSTLRVKRDDKRLRPNKITHAMRVTEMPKQPPTKDDAYSLFMKEMEGLL